MKGFCSYHGIHVPHDMAEEMLAAMPDEFKASKLQNMCADHFDVSIAQMPTSRLGYDADMRLADAILAFGKRRGLVRFDRSKRLWVKEAAE